MNARSAVITGGSGFIGARLAAHLRSQGLRVGVLDHRGGQGSVLDALALADAVRDVDTVFHLAGVLGTTELNEQVPLATEVNIGGTVKVLEACREAGTPRLFVCTKPNDWLNAYSVTKKAAEDLSRLYAAAFDMDVRILRWLNVYGPGQKVLPVRKAVPIMALQAIHDRAIEVFGSGEQPVELIYVDDLARVTAEYVLHGPIDASVRDTGLCVRMTVNEMAALIRELAGSRSEIVHLEMRPGEDETRHITRLGAPTAAEIVGLAEEPVDVTVGLARTLEYYKRLPAATCEEALDWHELQARRTLVSLKG